MRILLILVFAIGVANCSCPPGYELVNDSECRGNYTRATKPMGELITMCNAVLGNPIIIRNAEDQKYWVDRVNNSNLPRTMLGFTCNKMSKRWEWVDGTPLDYKPEREAPNLPAPYASYLDQECSGDYVGSMTNDGYWTYLSATNPFTMDIFCTLPLRQPPANGCNGFENDSDDGVCYQVATTATAWKEAQNICNSFGASVASIHNAQENSFIRRLAVSKGAIGGLFLGAAPTGKENEFGWKDGSKWDYDNFYPGFPMNGMGECLMMDTGVTAGYWANVDCSTKLSVVCMRNQNYAPPACSPSPYIEEQIMYSPGFPNDASTPCDFILSVDAGKKVELEVLLLEALPGYDNLIVYENYFGANIIANLTGIYEDVKYRTSSSNFMRVSWQPNGGYTVRGLMFTYRAV